MKFLIFLGAVVVAVHAASLFGDDQWTQYKIKFNKKYDSEDEDQSRMKIFLENKKMIEEHNARYERGEVTWGMCINQFADWSDEEREAFLSGFKVPSREEFENNAQVFTPSDDPVPDEIDWRTAGAVTSVKNQGACGSCWAFSAVGSLEGMNFIKNKKLVELSVQNLIDCSQDWGNYGCHGGHMFRAFEYVADNHGIDTEESYPYEGRDRKCRFKPENVGATCTGFTWVNHTEEALKQAVALKGPIAVAINVVKSFMFYCRGVYVSDTCRNWFINLNHGVVAIGYGHDNSTGLDYWLIKNSWGTHWGLEGYAKMARNQDNMCGIARFPSYPNM